MSGISQAFSFMRSSGVARSSQSYTTAGTYSWVAPAGVTSVSVVAIGGGGGQEMGGFCVCCSGAGAGGGGGGSLGYINTYSVTPGTSYSIVVGEAGVGTSIQGRHTSTNGGDSYFVSTAVVKGGGGVKGSYQCGGAGGTYTGTGGGNGGKGGNGGGNTCSPAGGGGSGGYSGAGSAGSNAQTGNSSAGTGGSASGGGTMIAGYPIAGGGGGVGILGQGTSGAAGTYLGGKGGSCGADAGNWFGGAYGGGGGGTQTTSFIGKGGIGAVRIVWPGNTRTFPSTCVGSP